MFWIPNFWGWEEGQVAAVDVCERAQEAVLWMIANQTKSGSEAVRVEKDWWTGHQKDGKQNVRSKSILLTPEKMWFAHSKSLMKDRDFH